VVFIQSSYISPSKCKCSSPSKNLVSCSFLISCLYSLNCFSYGYVICGTSCLCSLSYLSCGDVICGTSIFIWLHVPLLALPIPLLALQMVPLHPSSFSMPLIFVLSCSLYTLEPKVPPSSTLLFVLRTFLCEYTTTFFLYSSVVYIFSLVI
jgi:hypothetical protein